MKNELIAQLKSVGLPEKAALIYANVLESGTAFPSKISETTKLNRSTVYKILGDLRVRGLVTELERNKKLCYQIEDPSHLLSFAKDQISHAQKRHEKAIEILPVLQELYSLLPNKPKVRFFEGINGIIEIYDEHVSVNTPYEMLSYSNVEELIKLLPKQFIQQYIEKKERSGITTRAIFPDSLFSKSYNKKLYSQSPKNIRVDTRFIPADSFPFKADITVYSASKVSIINFHENTLVGVIIEDQTITGMMRMIFELAWKGTE